MSKRDDRVSLEDMRAHAREAITMLNAKDQNYLLQNRMMQLALTRLIEIIGEAANRVSAKTQERYSHVPWSEIIGMRNRMTHGYDNLDLEILFDTVAHDLPNLVIMLDEILDDR